MVRANHIWLTRLTEEAEHLFPKAYDVLLNQLIAVLKGRLTALALEEVLREVGRSLAGAQAASRKNGDMGSRIARALVALEAIGGAARVQTLPGLYECDEHSNLSFY